MCCAVLRRAMSLRSSLIFIGFSSCPVAFWRRSVKRDWAHSFAFAAFSSGDQSSMAWIFIVMRLPHRREECARDKPGLDPDLVPREAEGFARRLLVDAFHLEHDAGRLDDADPVSYTHLRAHETDS